MGDSFLGSFFLLSPKTQALNRHTDTNTEPPTLTVIKVEMQAALEILKYLIYLIAGEQGNFTINLIYVRIKDNFENVQIF